MVGEVSIPEANEIGLKEANKRAALKTRNPHSPCEFFHSQVVPYFMDRRMVAQRATDKGITPEAAVVELHEEWLAA